MTRGPKRLLDDDTLDARVRRDLEVLRGGSADYDVKAGLARFEAALDEPPGGGEGGDGGAGAATAGPALRLVLGGLLAAGSIAALAFVLLDEPAAPDGATGETAPAEIPAEPPVEAAPEPSPPREPPLAPTGTHPDGTDEPDEPENERLRHPASTAGSPRAAQASDSVEPVREVEASSVQDEIAHMARTRAALARDPAEALRLTEEGARRFPDGLFGEERAATAIFALERLGQRPEARRRAQAFLRRWPDGPFRERVQRIAVAE